MKQCSIALSFFSLTGALRTTDRMMPSLPIGNPGGLFLLGDLSLLACAAQLRQLSVHPVLLVAQMHTGQWMTLSSVSINRVLSVLA